MWYTEFGNSGDVVLSSRVRLARNIKGIPFGEGMKDADREKVIDLCRGALPDLKYIDLFAMSDAEKQALTEQHIISPDMAAKHGKCGILVNGGSDISVMLCEEDHVRIQAMAPGFSLDECLTRANEVDDRLEGSVEYGFDERFGYLTCCPTNVGTGLRASVMLHLPALTESGRIDGTIRSLSKLGMAVRGIYGEGSRASGNIYQISNQVTLGVSEQETVDKLKQLTEEVIQQERRASQELYEKNKLRLEDRVMRSFGTLTNARLLTSNETMNLFSDVRWGVNLGIIKNVNLVRLSEILYDTLPGSMIQKYNLADPTERDLKRAELFRNGLAGGADTEK